VAQIDRLRAGDLPFWAALIRLLSCTLMLHVVTAATTFRRLG
jgi:hypothetical protein